MRGSSRVAMFAAMAALAHSGLAMPHGVIKGNTLRPSLSRNTKARKERKQRGIQKPKTQFTGSDRAQATRMALAVLKRKRKSCRGKAPQVWDNQYTIGVDMAKGPDRGVIHHAYHAKDGAISLDDNRDVMICGVSWGPGRCKFGEYHLCTRNTEHKGKCLCERFDGSSTPCGARK